MSDVSSWRMLQAKASISQGYWGGIKEDWGSGDGSSPARSRGSPARGDEVSQKLKFFL